MRSVLAILLLSVATAALAQAPRNHVAGESSRYLQLHADDAVDWHSWNAETLAAAQRDNRPIFLSIGYASCHWCHEMREKVFSDPAVALLINGSFMPVLVDREERPDIDATYLAYVQSMTGSAGWPANLMLTPNLEPFWGASYVDAEELKRALVAGSARWKSEREGVVQSAREIVSASMLHPAELGLASPDELTALAEQAKALYDAEHGGFGSAPKFPRTLLLDALLRQSQRTNDAKLQAIVLDSLRKMAEGSIHDPIAGGFHRYATDAAWRSPHFEKMLYDQALLAQLYLEAYQIRHEQQFADVARDTLDYMVRDLCGKNGCASSQDSDSVVPGPNGPVLSEGSYYYWTHTELIQIMGKRYGDLFAFHYGIGPGKKLPYIAHSEAATRRELGITEKEWGDTFAAAHGRLLEFQEKRPQPARDEKRLAGWNGLAISALARGGMILADEKYLAAAETTANAVTAALWDPKSKKLRHSSTSPLAAQASDYAQLIAGLLDLYESTLDFRWLSLALELQQRQDELFWNEKETRYGSGSTLPDALAAAAVESDNDTPSVNSLSPMNLMRLAEMTGRPLLRDRALGIFRVLAARISNISYAQMASSFAMSLAPPRQIVLAAEPRREETRRLLFAINERFLPNRVVMLAEPRLGQWLPYVNEMKMIEEHPDPKKTVKRATAYICEERVCKAPTDDPDEVRKILSSP